MSNNPESFDDLAHEVMQDRDARCAAKHNALRRSAAVWLNERLRIRYRPLHAIAAAIGVEALDLQWSMRGAYSLKTIVRAADYCGYDVEFKFVKREKTDVRQA